MLFWILFWILFWTLFWTLFWILFWILFLILFGTGLACAFPPSAGFCADLNGGTE